MRLLLVRHGIAAALGGSVARDEDRPLTAQGQRRLRQVAAALLHLAPPPRAILTSPLLRARQTAEILAQAWGDLRPEIAPALARGDIRDLRRALAGFDNEDTILLIGHEHWISKFTAHLLEGKSGRAFRYRKGGVALIETAGKAQVRPRDPADAGRGTLLWFIPPRVFRKIQV
jgi:phosphohistidine phosphatase